MPIGSFFQLQLCNLLLPVYKNIPSSNSISYIINKPVLSSNQRKHKQQMSSSLLGSTYCASSYPQFNTCSGKRPYRSVAFPDLEQHFSAMKITEAGLVQISVKVPFPDSAIDNDGKCQNLIGRILGPRGISVRQLEMLYGCKILIRGKGSIKNAEKERRLRGKPEGRHLGERLHVLIEAQDRTRDQCIQKLMNAKHCIEKLMVPVVFDEYKRQQLIQLAIINGTYRSRVRKENNNSINGGGGASSNQKDNETN